MAVTAAVVVVVMMVVVVMVMIVMMVMIVEVMIVHNDSSFIDKILTIILFTAVVVKGFIFPSEPPVGLAAGVEMGYNHSEKEAWEMSQQHDHEYLQIHSIPHPHIHENQKAVLNRLARAIGHLEKVRRMVEDGSDCADVLIQLAAVRSALDNTGKVILKDHMRHCMVDAVAAGNTEAIDDLCQAVDKFMK